MMSIKNYWQEGGKIAFAYAFAEAIVQWVILKLLHTFAPRKWDRTLKLNISNRCIATLHAIGKCTVRFLMLWFSAFAYFLVRLFPPPAFRGFALGRVLFYIMRLSLFLVISLKWIPV